MSGTPVWSIFLKLFLAVVIGYVLNRKKILGPEATKGISGLIVNVTCPALVLYSVTRQEGAGGDVLLLVAFGVAMYAVLPFLAKLLARPTARGPGGDGVFQMMLVFANVNFMGFPVVQAIYGEGAIFYDNLLHLPFFVLLFTYGIRLLRGKREAGARIRVGDILTPGLLAGLASLAVYFLRVPVPPLVVESLGFIGGITTPLSMIAVGSILADFDFRDILSDRRLFYIAFVKLVALPLAGWLLAGLVFRDPMMVGLVTISLGMPAASLCAMLGRQYGGPERGKTAALGVLLTTALSFVTIPVLIVLLSR